jgi:hypothetical protein
VPPIKRLAAVSAVTNVGGRLETKTNIIFKVRVMRKGYKVNREPTMMQKWLQKYLRSEGRYKSKHT